MNDYEGDMFLETGKKYKFMLMIGSVIEGTITDPNGAYNTFHVKVGQTTKQYYYWDVDYGYPLELN